MRIGALAELAPAPGRVVVLRPTAECQAAAELAGPQMVSYLDVRKFPGAGTAPFDFELVTQNPDTEQGGRAVATFFEAAHDVLAELGLPVHTVDAAEIIGTGHAGHDR